MGFYANRKSLGRTVTWVCGICGKMIQANTTTIAFVTGSHIRSEWKRGLRWEGKWNYGDDLYDCSINWLTRKGNGST